MDGNKDEAIKCLKIANDSIRSGDRNRAVKFLDKARRLDPSIEIDDLLSSLGSQENNPDENPSDPSRTGPRRRVPTPATGPSTSSSSASFTEDHVTVVREIKRKKDYYEILGLEKSCSTEEIRKAYRKISLKVHPDKNQAPGAEEAFKMVSKAFQCLSDDESRRRYDLVGSEEPIYQRQERAGGVNGMQGFYDVDVDAEEIFRNFFFGGMHPATTGNFSGFTFGTGGVRVRTGGVDQGSSNWLRTLIQLLPVILFLLVNLLPSSEPIYSLNQTYSYGTRFITPKGVNYYVKSAKFDQDYPLNTPERMSIEQRVEEDYHSILVHNCRLEWQQMHWGYRRETPNCDALKGFEAKAQ